MFDFYIRVENGEIIYVLYLTVHILAIDDSQEIKSDLKTKNESSVRWMRGCYFTNWAQYRPEAGKYMPSNYIPGLCTHIFYAFAWMNEDYTIRSYEWNDESTEWSKGLYELINNHKVAQPDLKTLLSLGGWTFGTRLFKEMTATEAKRKVFIDSVISFVRAHGFDGFDLDWEYPDTPADRTNFVLLLKEIMAAFKAEAASTGRPRLLLTAAVAGGYNKIVAGYDVPNIARYVDWINIMSYDFHGAWESFTGMNSPLYSSASDSEEFRNWTVSGAAISWKQLGMPADKIAVGLATYARGWTLASSADVGVGAKAVGPSKATDFVREAGVASYYEIGKMIEEGAKRYFDNVTKVPYIVKGDQWFSYDDAESFEHKLNFTMGNGYKGAFVWTLDFDDFNGQCAHSDRRKYPLISKMKETFTGVFAMESEQDGRPTDICEGKQDGFTPRPGQCQEFVLCLDNVSYGFRCPAGLRFNDTLKYCVHDDGSRCASDTRDMLPRRFSEAPTERVSVESRSLLRHHQQRQPFTCMADGYYRDPIDCGTFYRCEDRIAYRFRCPAGLAFNERRTVCDRLQYATC